MKFETCRSIAIVSLFAGALTPVHAQNPPNPARENVERLTPYLHLERRDGSGCKLPVQTYTSLQVLDKTNLSGTVDYQTRTGFQRFFNGKKAAANFVLNAEIGSARSVTPLLTRDYTSSRRSGESFDRQYRFDRHSFPLFLVDSDPRNGVASFELSANITENSDSGATAFSIGLLTKVVGAVAPTSGVITTLNQDSTNEAATAIDDAIAQLFATSIKETLDFDLRVTEGRHYRIKIYGPETELDEFNPTGTPLGVWTVGFSEPRYSIFSDIAVVRFDEDTRRAITNDVFSRDFQNGTVGQRECIAPQNFASGQAQVFAEATANSGRVLSFQLVDKVGELGTVLGYLRQQDWWADTLTEINTANGANIPDAQFCRLIRSSIAEIGLNDLDGRIISHAVANSGMVRDPAKSLMENDADCIVQGT